jgi:hypothetical protein
MQGKGGSSSMSTKPTRYAPHDPHPVHDYPIGAPPSRRHRRSRSTAGNLQQSIAEAHAAGLTPTPKQPPKQSDNLPGRPMGAHPRDACYVSLTPGQQSALDRHSLPKRKGWKASQ